MDISTKEREKVDKDFEVLDLLLSKTELDTEKQGKRKAQAGEFMWMHEKIDAWHGRVVGFKHRDTRNYIFVLFPTGRDRTPVLEIPKTGIPFRLGYFDVMCCRHGKPIGFGKCKHALAPNLLCGMLLPVVKPVCSVVDVNLRAAIGEKEFQRRLKARSESLTLPPVLPGVPCQNEGCTFRIIRESDLHRDCPFSKPSGPHSISIVDILKLED